nr:MAG TPA: hypothetical protein [Caudoviricetes sp.]
MERLQDIGQILALCVRMTNLNLEASCGFDRQFAAQWYENEYLTGKHTRYVMKPDLSITSYEDGKVYRAFNCGDAKAIELMEANPEYRDYFIDLDAVVTTIPELGDDPFASEQTEPEQTEPEAEAAEPTPEEIAEAEAAAKRSEAAKKAAATRAANKAAAEAAAAAAADISEFE